MDITNKTIWQQAAGDTDRDYAELCIKWGVILNGPGYAGRWPDCKGRLLESDRSSRKITDLKRFCDDMQDGDIVVLRHGTNTVRAVGQVVGAYEYREEFGDIDGWDLQHVRRVRWLWHNIDRPEKFKPYALKLGDTTQKLNEGPVSDWLSSLEIAPDNSTLSLAKLPTSNEKDEVQINEISEFLFDQGVAAASITNLINEIGELTRIAKWYQRSHAPSERETVAYLVAPLLRALGWTPQRMAIEWNRVDIALFEQLPRSDQSLQVVVEAKKMGNSCLTAKSQANDYAEGKTKCRRLIVTDGLRYGIYTRNGMNAFDLYAYFNLTRLMRAYPVYGCKGIKDALLAMTPEWKSD
ncbi:hypothetical protein [Ferrovibrio sp.]|uniref:hypothetical protein n=1 Tax=Ferrovibrio sp. TaxID=1917215 RepID=UPI0025C35A64|nr:hypothetical protein [Ferrovibrio sp.]MBX3456035.1 hypothetical protein [Ferrovibrio sp.]